MIGGIFDRYWGAKIAVRFAVIVSIIPAILALENLRRLLAEVEKSSDAMALLVRLSVALVPEHLSAAVPVALMLASALTVRQMILRGEWQIAAAAGMSRLRIMAVPLAFAALVAGAQFAIRFELRPAGERALDAIYHELQTGEHGLPLPVGQPIELDAGTTIFVGGIGGGGTRHLEDVVVRRGEDSFSAPRADIGFSPDGGVRLRLRNGVGVIGAGPGQARAVRFDRMDFSGRPPASGVVDNDAMHQFDMLSGGALLQKARDGTPLERRLALTALVMRADSVLFCLLIPWFAILLGKPPRRKESAAGILVAIVLVVLHLKLAASIEANFAAHVLLAEMLNLGLWTAAAAGLVYLEQAHGEGVVDVLVARLVEPLRRLRRDRRALRGRPAAPRVGGAEVVPFSPGSRRPAMGGSFVPGPERSVSAVPLPKAAAR
ncbi:LptF/LptG family permease [Sphingomonas sp. CBMAI 2297]|uniref:LptF/LptG family permease n=1 Tax=Sphingomonas sp. CBMAI 2297 TaxID=2991720 RepID=UPI00245772C9|nr:LptF/LptG family permease [Sphingomonas sp. CBMAI 2297]MDH4744497.1 LptF/LptG family permease [Sphingomonas sp. CBMAI 2297]